MTRRPFLNRAQFLDPEAYARAVRAAGPPDMRDLDLVRGLAGDDGKILDMIWGSSAAQFDAMVEAEFRAEVRRSPHKFIQKYAPPRRRGVGKPG